MSEPKDLLAQADALMRRPVGNEEEVPILTEIIDLTPNLEAATVNKPAAIQATPTSQPLFPFNLVMGSSPDPEIHKLDGKTPDPTLELGALSTAPPTWQQLQEEIYHRVLQNLDLYTDQAIQVYLAEQLNHILKQALQRSVAGIGQQIGGLLRDYIAQALDKEMAQVRSNYRQPSNLHD